VVSAACIALYAEEDVWCAATVVGERGAGRFLVKFTDYGGQQAEVAAEEVWSPGERTGRPLNWRPVWRSPRL
jgi:hypothetical protein